MGTLFKLVGEYPTYVLQLGAFLAGACFFLQGIKMKPFSKFLLFYNLSSGREQAEWKRIEKLV